MATAPNGTMKLTVVLAAISLTSVVAAAPVQNTPRNLIPGLPTPMDVVEKMYPNSGIPRLAGKLEKELHICISYTRNAKMAITNASRTGTIINTPDVES